MLTREEKLLTVEDYARSYGISPEIVNACIEAGLLAKRSHNGKQYVVNIPLSPYLKENEKPGNDISSRRTAKQAPQIQAGSIAELVEKMAQKAAEIKKITAKTSE